VEIANNALELRKSLDELLELKKHNIVLKDIPNSNRKEMEASVWNHLGIYFLSNRMYSDAVTVYMYVLETITEAEAERKVDIHKGLPLYNMGVAQLYLRNYDEGIPNILRAFEEDVRTVGQTAAQQQLASKVKEGISEFSCKIIDGNYLKEFVNKSGIAVKNTICLMQNMDETEKLFFAKIINSSKLITFHDDIYTRVVMFDNIRNLALLLESNLKRRSRTTLMLSGLISAIFSGTSWQKTYQHHACLASYEGVGDFENNLKTIATNVFSKKPEEDFIIRNLLTTQLIRNFTAHYLNEKLSFLSNSVEYFNVFKAEVFSILYCLDFKV
jgi:tetratricopeptide (TPR) repeat protein